MKWLRERLFMRNHMTDCASTHARELARVGVEKRRKRILERAAEMRRELGMPPSPVLNRR